MYENKITSFVSRVVNDDLLEDDARLVTVEYAKAEVFKKVEIILRSATSFSSTRERQEKMIYGISNSLGQLLHFPS